MDYSNSCYARFASNLIIIRTKNYLNRTALAKIPNENRTFRGLVLVKGEVKKEKMLA